MRPWTETGVSAEAGALGIFGWLEGLLFKGRQVHKVPV